MICLLEEGNTAISIKGNARISKKNLSVLDHCAMVEVGIEHIKSDVTGVANIFSGVKCEINDSHMEITKNIYNEIMK